MKLGDNAKIGVIVGAVITAVVSILAVFGIDVLQARLPNVARSVIQDWMDDDRPTFYSAQEALEIGLVDELLG